MRPLVPGAAVAALVFAAAAAAHGPARAPGFVSTVIEVRPNVLGLTATVLGGDEKLSIRNWSGKTVVVLDPRGAPMFRFAADGVYRRSGGSWQLVNPATGYSWHDRRIHWTGAEAPRVVRDAPDRDHLLGSWRIPLVVAGRRATIEGTLGWSAQPAAEPAERDEPRWLVPAAVAGGLLAAAALAVPLLVQRRRGPRRATGPRTLRAPTATERASGSSAPSRRSSRRS